MLIIVEPPGFNDVLGLGERAELMHIQTLVSQSAVKGLNKGILYGFTWSNEVELHPPADRLNLRAPVIGIPSRDPP